MLESRSGSIGRPIHIRKRSSRPGFPSNSPRLCFHFLEGLRSYVTAWWSKSLLRDPINFLTDEFFGEAAPLEDPLGIGDHFRVAAEVSRGIRRFESERIQIFSEHVFRAADFALPGRVLPGTADRGNVAQPLELLGQ